MASMKTKPATAFKAHLSALLDEVTTTHEEVTITRNGEPVAVLLSFEEYEAMQETIALASDPAAQARIAESEQSFVDGTFTTEDEMAALMRARGGRGRAATP
jgi:antitoxin YefM